MNLKQMKNIGKNTKEEAKNAKIKVAYNAAYKYGNDHIDELDSNCTNVSIKELIDLGYVETDENCKTEDKDETCLINPLDNTSLNDEEFCIFFRKREVLVNYKDNITNHLITLLVYADEGNLIKDETKTLTIEESSNENKGVTFELPNVTGYSYKSDKIVCDEDVKLSYEIKNQRFKVNNASLPSLTCTINLDKNWYPVIINTENLKMEIRHLMLLLKMLELQNTLVLMIKRLF